MSDIHVPPPTPAPGPEFPIVVLETMPMNMIMHPNGQHRLLVLGPLMVGIPIGGESERWLIDNLNAAASGLIIARPGGVQPSG